MPGSTDSIPLPATPLLRLFGAPALANGGAPFSSERRFQLLAYLACRRTWVKRDQLAALFWPERDNASARSNLRKVLFLVQQVPGLRGFETGADTVRWDIDSDLARFETALAQRDWFAALAWVQGPLADGLDADAGASFSEWLHFEREQVRARWRDAASHLFDDPDCAASTRAEAAQRVLQVDPLDEAAVIALLQTQVTLQQPAQAQRTYREYAQRLADELGVEPSAPIRALARSLNDAPRTHGPTPAPKPAPGAPLIGRRVEMMELRRLLAEPGCRVLTITGPGGIGKSTLARAALGVVADDYADGTAWIALEDLNDVAQVAPRIAALLGIDLHGQADPVDTVIEALRAADRLLVFDNSEHLPQLPALLGRLMTDCPRVKLLNASRARLALDGEWLLPIDGLPVPDADELDPDLLRSFDSVRLFEARASSATPSFDLAAQAADVVALLHAVGGMPLAIELAAAWVNLLPVGEIVRDLAQSLDVLDRGGADRNRSVQVSFDRSWQQLTPREQTALAQLATLPGSFSAAAAQHVAAAPLPILATLVDKSLVRADGSGRFSLHALLLQFGRERNAEADATWDRHVAFYAQFLARHRDFERVNQREALAAIELELHNAMAAWRRSVDLRHGLRLQQMALPLMHFFEVKGRWQEGIALLQRAMQLDPRDPAQKSAVATVRRALATLQFRSGALDEAETNARGALKLCRELGDRDGVKASLRTLGLVYWQHGRRDEARRYFSEALKRAEADNDVAGIASSCGNLGLVEKAEGRYDVALPLYERALVAQREIGDMSGVASKLNNIGNLLRVARAHSAALLRFEEGLQICRDHGLKSTECFLLANIGLTHLDAHDYERALPYCRQALVAVRSAGERQIEIVVLLALTRIAIAHVELREGAEHLLQALRLARAMRAASHQVVGMILCAEWLTARGACERAAALLQFTIGHSANNEADRVGARELLDALALPAEVLRRATMRAGQFELESLVEELSGELETAVTSSEVPVLSEKR